MRCCRPTVALFAAYALVVASVLGAVASSSTAGSSHYQLCITSAQDDKPLPPAHSGDQGLCCFIANNGHSAALPPESAELQALIHFRSESVIIVSSRVFIEENFPSANPRAPPARI